MPSRAEILDPEREHPFTVTASSGDRRTSVSSSVIRCIYDGQRAVAVGNDASAKTQIAALLDLLHLHYDGADEATPSVANRDEVTIILGDHKNEAVDALCTLREQRRRRTSGEHPRPRTSPVAEPHRTIHPGPRR